MPEYHGLLLLDKPPGPTSHDVVDRVRKALGIRAVGHAGTLDPFASGLLLLGVGKGTKALTALVGQQKTYWVQARLNAFSDTFDRMGAITEVEHPRAAPSAAELTAVLEGFLGEQDQRAPIYSAIKRDGKKLYELARAGQITDEERPVRRITIHELHLVEVTWPSITFAVTVSSGTYIRSLVDDIGAKLGTRAYVEELRRTHIGPYSVQGALIADHLTREAVERALLPLP